MLTAGFIIRTIQTMDNTKLLSRFRQFLVQQDLSEISIKGYLYDMTFFQRWVIDFYQEDIPFLKLSINDLRAFRESLSKIKRQKPSTINRRIQSIKRFYQWTKLVGLISNNPSETLRFLRHRTTTQPAALLQKEVHALLRAAGQSSHGLAKRNYALIQVMLQTGLRMSEVVHLQVRDLSIHDRSGHLEVVEGKGRRHRVIPLNATVRRALSIYLDSFEALNPENFVFVSKRGTQMGARAIQKIIEGIVKRANIQRIKVSAHTLRHTFATHYLAANPNGLLELSALMGHESLNTTAIYTKSSAEKLAKSLERSEINIYGDS